MGALVQLEFCCPRNVTNRTWVVVGPQLDQQELLYEALKNRPVHKFPPPQQPTNAIMFDAEQLSDSPTRHFSLSDGLVGEGWFEYRHRSHIEFVSCFHSTDGTWKTSSTTGTPQIRARGGRMVIPEAQFRWNTIVISFLRPSFSSSLDCCCPAASLPERICAWLV